MSLKRYARTQVLGLNFQYGTSTSIQMIREGVANGAIRTKKRVLAEGQRLDSIAAEEYGADSANDWWLIAAASNIGWVAQVPPGTILIIPDRRDVSELVG